MVELTLFSELPNYWGRTLPSYLGDISLRDLAPILPLIKIPKLLGWEMLPSYLGDISLRDLATMSTRAQKKRSQQSTTNLKLCKGCRGFNHYRYTNFVCNDLFLLHVYF